MEGRSRDLQRCHVEKSAPAGGGFAGSERAERVCVCVREACYVKPTIRKHNASTGRPVSLPQSGGRKRATGTSYSVYRAYEHAALAERRSTDSFGRPPLDNVGSVRTMDGVSSDMEVSALGQVPAV